MKYGYRSRDSHIELKEPKDLKIVLHSNFVETVGRSPMQASTGVHVSGVSLPHPDVKDPFTMLDGVTKRIGARLPTPQRSDLLNFKEFVKVFVKSRFTPLSPDVDLSFEKWIEDKDYPEWRKQELREIYGNIPFDPEVTAGGKRQLPKKYTRVKSFMKRETYPERKHGRGIFSRADEMKVLFGPLCSLIEQEVYSHPEFIKHVPVSERAKFIQEFFGNDATTFIATDYSSFESSFTKILMECCENVLFDHMTQFLKGKLESRIKYYTNGVNVAQFKWFTVLIDACRMSGEMDTSLSNGFTNICVFYYLAYCKGEITLADLAQPPAKVRAIVEGDDLLGYMNGVKPVLDDYAKLGFNCKIELHKTVTTASFCGMIFDPEDGINLTDPRKVLANFGWVDSIYAGTKQSRMRTLLRCKALSVLCQYSGCPILQELGLYGLRVTRDRSDSDLKSYLETDRRLSSWDRANYKKMLEKEQTTRVIGMRSRLLMEEKFGITVEQQLECEAYLRSLRRIQPLDLTMVDFPREWELSDSTYVHPQRVKEDGAFEVPLYIAPGDGTLDYKFKTISFRSR